MAATNPSNSMTYQIGSGLVKLPAEKVDAPHFGISHQQDLCPIGKAHCIKAEPSVPPHKSKEWLSWVIKPSMWWVLHYIGNPLVELLIADLQ